MRLFVDSCAWISLFDKADKYHEAASQNLRQIRDRAQLVTSDYVLDEALTFLLYQTNKDIAVQCGRWALNADFLDILWVDETVWRNAWGLFQNYDDKEWAFTDCTSFALMRQHDLWRAFTFDNHFAQAGFLLWPGDV